MDDRQQLLERIKALSAFSAEGADGQEKRAAARFALFALAGEVATEYGLTGWQEGEAVKAAAEGYRTWLAARGRGNDERRQIMEQVATFIERHGSSRFCDEDDVNATVRDQAGWWRDERDGRIYLFNKDGMREALKGHDFYRALKVLAEMEVLKPESESKRAKVTRIRAHGTATIRLYHIHPDKLERDA